MRISDWIFRRVLFRSADRRFPGASRRHDPFRRALFLMDMASASLATAPAFEEPASEESGNPHLRGCPVTFPKLKALLAAALYRYAGRPGFGAFAKHYAFPPGYQSTFLMLHAGRPTF